MSYPGYRTTWVASPPPGASQPPLYVPPRRYLGPPSYAVPPRWGIPVLAWRRPAVTERADPVQHVRALCRQVSVLLVVTAALAVLAAGAETWRYVLLLASRTSALSGGTVSASDTLVQVSSWLTLLMSLLTGVFAVVWLRAARDAAGLPPRPVRQYVLLLVPIANLVLAVVLLTELEHAAGRTSTPRPGPLLRWWSAVWAGGELYAILVVALGFRGGVQAHADGVVLHALADLSAAALTVLTLLVVRRITAYLGPAPGRFERVLRVIDAPEPALRTERAAGSPR